MYRYREEDMSQEELFLKNQLVIFYQEFGYVGGVVTFNVVSKNRFKICIMTRKVVDPKSKKERKKVYGK